MRNIRNIKNLKLSRDADLPKLVYIVTVAMTADHLLRGQLRTMRNQGFDVTLITSPSPNLAEVAQREGITVIEIPMEREIAPKRDCQALWKVYRELRRLRPQIVNASTPKAGLLGMIAAWLARVPIRIYVLRGLRLETTSGIQHFVLSLSERLTAICAHQIVCVGHSLLSVYANLGFVAPNKLTVLGNGASNGVMIERFVPHSIETERIVDLRATLKLPPTAPTIGFVGRFTRDKGIIELIDAFELVLRIIPEAHLLLVGRFEQGDPVPMDVIERIQNHAQIRLTGFVEDTAPYYQLMDILAFPSYREGFPNVPLEAAVAGVPTVGFSATGTIDAVQHTQTGLLVPIGATDELAQQMLKLLQNEVLRKEMGARAQQWAIQNFDARLIWKNWAIFFQQCLAQQS